MEARIRRSQISAEEKRKLREARRVERDASKRVTNACMCVSCSLLVVALAVLCVLGTKKAFEYGSLI